MGPRDGVGGLKMDTRFLGLAWSLACRRWDQLSPWLLGKAGRKHLVPRA